MNEIEYAYLIKRVKTYPLWLKIALTLWGEARNQPLDGMIAVAYVMLRREQNEMFWDDITSPKQFSCWNINDSNLEKVCNVKLQTDIKLQECIEIAFGIINGEIKDTSNGADHYHTKNINPGWAVNMAIRATIGNHVFRKA